MILIDYKEDFKKEITIRITLKKPFHMKNLKTKRDY